MSWTHLVIHEHELALKRGNRDFFERRFLDNIRGALVGLPFGRPVPFRGRVIVPIKRGAAIDEQEVMVRIRHLFGASHAALSVEIPLDLPQISHTAVELVRQSGARSFRISAERGDKLFPLTSVEINRQVGEIVGRETGLAVSLKQADVTLAIEILPNAAYISNLRLPGPGGLPVGTSGKFGVLLSGGIDSPVAAYEIMKRGGECVFVHFHSVPYTDRASIEKVREMSQLLGRLQGGGRLFLLPFADIQKQVVMEAPQELRVILYRRLMIRVAESLLRDSGVQALVTGENLGQVASQTIENIRAVEEAATLPVLRPLITRNKEDIISQARKIGTYEISIRPHEDCCTVFMPRHPSTRSSLEAVGAAEAALSIDDLVEKSILAVEQLDLPNFV